MADEEDAKKVLAAFEAALTDALPKLEEMTIRHRERRAAWEREHGPHNAWMRALAEEIFTMDGLECWIIKSALWQEREEKGTLESKIGPSGRRSDELIWGMCGYCGYVVHPQRPTIEPKYDGIVAYIPVHGGVTYAHHDAFGSVYGFDTAHCDSEKLPTRDKEWIRGQIDILARGLLIAASIEEEYLKADGDNARRAELVQPILDLQPEERLSFKVMLNLLTGEL